MTFRTRAPVRRTAGGPLSAAGFIVVTMAVGGSGAAATASNLSTWYAALRKPPFNPPNAVFGPVWTVLYISMAIAAWRVWRSAPPAPRRTALVLYGVQLVLNFLWSVIFFGLRQPGAAFAEVLVLFAAVMATGAAFWRQDRWAGVIMVPYAAWVAFAGVLNLAVWRLN